MVKSETCRSCTHSEGVEQRQCSGHQSFIASGHLYR